MKHIGVTVGERGAALVHVEHGDADDLLCTHIERLPFNLEAIADRLWALDGELAEVRFVVDADGLGNALWQVLDPPRPPAWLAPHDPTWDRWALYSERGLARQALVDGLLVAIAERRFHFMSHIPAQEAMTSALQSYRRQVGADGVVGSELVVALLLALIPPPPPIPEPNFAWGGPPWGDNEVDGIHVGGIVIRQTPSGGLVGIAAPTEPEEKP
jgi:hypothetical protein